LTGVVEDTNVSDNEIIILLNQGLREIAVAFEWPFLQDAASLDLTDSTRTIALPNDFLYGAVLMDNDKDTILPFIAPATFFSEVGDGGTRESTNPDFFTIWAGNIYLHPIPEATDSGRLNLYFYKDMTMLAATGDSPQFEAAFHWILVEYAKWKLYDREEYYDQSERAFITYSRYLADMVDWYKIQFRRYPMLWGDGAVSRRRGDPNLPDLYRI
jgi:hypothetical protein